ncbi:hypothetical protein J7K50_05750, partial [bacterium]|nr:hypothetical protein [bacterium]
LALDPEGRIGLFYTDVAEAKYAVFDGVNWNYEPTGIDMEIYPWFSCFGYRGDIPWVVRARETVTVFEKQEDSWTPTIVGIPDPNDWFEHRVCSSSGEKLCICASEFISHKTWIWQYTGDFWLREKLYDTGEELRSRTEAIASNESSVAVVIFIDTDPEQYVLAYRKNGDWQYELLLHGDASVQSNSMIFAQDGSIWIAYTDLEEDALYFASRVPFEE